MSKMTKRLFTAMLSIMLVFGNVATAFAETLPDGTKQAGDNAPKTELTVKEIDPDSTGVKKLGDGFEKPADQQPEKLYDDDDIVRVSIRLSKDSVLEAGYPIEDIAYNKKAVSYRKNVAKQQTTVTKKIERKLDIKLDVVWNLTLATNMISANVRYGDIDAIRKIAGVVDVFLENHYEVEKDDSDPDTAITAQYMTYAAYAWAMGYTGAGSKIAIIDTGTNQDHISFDPDALEYSLTRDGKTLDDYDLLTLKDVEELLPQLNANNKETQHNISSAEDAYKNLKIPFAYNYVDGGFITDHDHDNQGEHGSHVSGIAAANYYVKVDGQFVEAIDSVYAVGMAPDAQILTMKVFGENGGASDSDYMAAIEDAIILGADSINLSLGSPNGFSFAEGYQEVMDSLVESGAVVTISAGNNYGFLDFNDLGSTMPYATDNNLNTAGMPGSYINSLSVAAADNVGGVGTPLIFNGARKAYYTQTQNSGADMVTIAGDYKYVYINGYGTADEFAAVNNEVSLEGKIVLVNRGSISFYVKANNAKSYNPAAVVIVNNTTGPISMNLKGYTGTFPVVSILRDTGAFVRESSTDHLNIDGIDVYVGNVEVSDVIQTGVEIPTYNATIAQFSSWGVPASLLMKPEITAPGGYIWSVNGMTDDGYEIMGGTSMSAPHVAGLAAVVGQYIEEEGLEEKTGLSKRALTNSLLMSTAVPMILDGDYVSVLRQGSGLADVEMAVTAKSLIMMNEDATLSYADGKVKVEIGQDAGRSGKYTFSFNLTNLSDETNTYDLLTHVFTQWLSMDQNYNMLMSTETILLNPEVTYDWVKNSISSYDVDKDGDTDDLDAQAILDYLTGNRKATDTDLTKADFDGNGKITSYDAQQLLVWLEAQEMGDELILNGGESAKITVTIELDSDETEFLEMYYPNGFYIEGYTYVFPEGLTEDEAEIDPAYYSIPILGYYGSWTDPTMFETTSVLEQLYGDTKKPYFGDATTNMLEVRYPGSTGTTFYTGNPYAVEDEWPADRLAVNSNTLFADTRYILTRNAGTLQAIAFDENGNILWNTENKKSQDSRWGAFYHVNTDTWYYNKANVYRFNTTATNMGLSEGDKFTFGLFAVPEYYALNPDMNSKDGTLTTEQVVELYRSGELGDGALIGYTFTVDDHAPVLLEDPAVSEDGKTLTIKIQDNQYVAYVAITDIMGENAVYATVPEQSSANEVIELTVDLSEIELPQGAALFIGDYAGNEAAYLIDENSGPITYEEKVTVYRLVDKMTADKNYLISEAAAVGKGHVLETGGLNEASTAAEVEINYDEELGLYIKGSDVTDYDIWTSNEYRQFENAGDGGWLGYDNILLPFRSWSQQGFGDVFIYEDYSLIVEEYADYQYGALGLFFYNGAFTLYLAGDVYLYEEYTYTVEHELDPHEVSEVIVSPQSATLIMGVNETVELTASLLPIVVTDKAVIWSSDNEEVVKVDENGLVTAVAPGRANIIATSHKTPSVSGSAEITVLESQPVDAAVHAQIKTKEGVKFVEIDLNDMTSTDLGGTQLASFSGGGRNGNWIYGNDADSVMYRYDATNGFACDNDYTFAANPQFAIIDGAAVPPFKSTFESTVFEHNFDLSAFTEEGDWMFTYRDEQGANKLTRFTLGSSGLFNGVAIDYIGCSLDDETGNPVLYYLFLTSESELGIIWVYDYSDEDYTGMYCEWEFFGKLDLLKVGNDLTAYSMAYVAEELEDEGIIERVFISDNTAQAIYMVNLADTEIDGETVKDAYVGRVKDSLNISTLWGDYDSDTALADSAVIKKVRMAADKAGSLKAEMAVEADAPVEKQSSTPNGSIDAIKEEISVIERISGIEIVDLKSVVKTENESDGTVSVCISDDTDLNNALYTVTYDPDVLEFVSFEPYNKLEYKSFSVDEEKGEIKFSFAGVEAIDDNTTLAQIKFQPKCDDAEVKVVQNEANDNTELNDETAKEIKGIGHDWKKPTWQWNDDNTAATATFVCNNDPEHVRVIDAEIGEEVVKPANGEEDGEKIVRATVIGPDGEEYVDEKTVAIPAHPETPDTGDHSMLGLYIAMMIVSGLGMGIVGFRKRRVLN